MVVAMWWMLVKGHTGDVNMAILTPNLLGFAFVSKMKSPLSGGKKLPKSDVCQNTICNWRLSLTCLVAKCEWEMGLLLSLYGKYAPALTNCRTATWRTAELQPQRTAS